jgi:hypothetical protein
MTVLRVCLSLSLSPSFGLKSPERRACGSSSAGSRWAPIISIFPDCVVEGSGEEEGVEETVVGGGVEVVGRENLGEGVREESRFLNLFLNRLFGFLSASVLDMIGLREEEEDEGVVVRVRVLRNLWRASKRPDLGEVDFLDSVDSDEEEEEEGEDLGYQDIGLE